LKNHSRICRACSGLLFPEPILKYEDSPSSAQGFLNKEEDIDFPVNLEIFQCSKCGVVQHCLPPVAYYKEVIRAVAFSDEMATFRKKQLKNWIHKHNIVNKNIIEIGCGKGEYLDLLEAAGSTKVTGIEYSRKNIAIATQKDKAVIQGFIDPNFKKPDAFTFDAFAIFSFMEHWPNPCECLEALYSCLSQDAVGLIEVPNFELIIKKGLYSEFTVDHIFYYDKNSLKFILEKNGFEVIAINEIWYDYILSAEVRKRSPLDVSEFVKTQDSIKNELKNYLSNFESKSVAVWGAGHQALAVIAMAKIDNKLKYVVDSATFKQGKYTPATKLPIVSPKTMLKDAPVAIIVMAAGYSDEVVELIMNYYSGIKNIAVLREDYLELIA